jgi:signal peptidase
MTEATAGTLAGTPSGLIAASGGTSHVAGPWRMAWVAVIPAIVAVYLLINLRFPEILPGGFNIYLAQPATWLSLALLAYLGWRYGLAERAATRPGFVGLAALVGAFQISLFVIAGLAFGFGRSPYGHHPEVLLGNLVYIGTMLLGVETARAYLLGVVGPGRPLAGILLVSLLFTILSIPAARLGGLENAASGFRFAGEMLLPRFSEHLLASLLALLGGPLASLAFRAVVECFEWTSPILPNLPWPVMGLVGSLAPVLGMLVIQTHVRPAPSSARPESSWPSAWVLPAFLGVFLIWFNQGLFGITPTVVSGVSMRPMLQAGDLVLSVSVAPEEIGVGDIIRFRAGESYVLHRVVEIRHGGSLEFVTRGDANNVDDSPLPAHAVEGRVVRILPGLGWPSVGVRMGLQWALDLIGS